MKDHSTQMELTEVESREAQVGGEEMVRDRRMDMVSEVCSMALVA